MSYFDSASNITAYTDAELAASYRESAAEDLAIAEEALPAINEALDSELGSDEAD